MFFLSSTIYKANLIEVFNEKSFKLRKLKAKTLRKENYPRRPYPPSEFLHFTDTEEVQNFGRVFSYAKELQRVKGHAEHEINVIY